MSVPNQKIMRNVKDFAFDKKHPYAMQNVANAKEVMKTLSPAEFEVWYALNSNGEGFNFELSQKAMEEEWGIARQTYYRAIDKFIELGFIVPIAEGSNIYTVHESMQFKNGTELCQDGTTQSQNETDYSQGGNTFSQGGNKHSQGGNTFSQGGQRNNKYNKIINNNKGVKLFCSADASQNNFTQETSNDVSHEEIPEVERIREEERLNNYFANPYLAW